MDKNVIRAMALIRAYVIDMSYFERITDEARNQIDYFGEYTRFIGG